jgi:hypothetical protein
MFSNVTIGLIFAIGFGGWVYAKINRSTGGNTTSALTVAGGAGLIAFLLIVIILGKIFPS